MLGNQQERHYVLEKWQALTTISGLRFGIIQSEKERQQLKAFRLATYANNLAYMLNQIGESGLDAYDDYSTIYAAWYKDNLVASIRLTPYPYESTKYIATPTLGHYLGEGWEKNYVEWSRLLIDTSFHIKGLLKTITIYAGLHTLANTHYAYYFGYTRRQVRRLFSSFELDNTSLSFTIPSRGNHSYSLLKGSFLSDYEKVKTYLLNT
jgi:hypothetical protein